MGHVPSWFVWNVKRECNAGELVADRHPRNGGLDGSRVCDAVGLPLKILTNG